MEDGIRVFCGEGGKIVKQASVYQNALIVAGARGPAYKLIICILYV